MKKITVFLTALMVVMCANAFGATDADRCMSKLYYEAGQRLDGTQFIYQNATAYGIASDKYDSGVRARGGTRNVNDGLGGDGWECDNNYCGNGTTFVAPNGHYFNGSQHDERVYQCVETLLHDQWRAYDITDCPDSAAVVRTDMKTSDGYEIYRYGYTASNLRYCKKAPCSGCECDGSCNPEPAPNPAPEPSPFQKCLGRSAAAESKACCYLSESVAKWDGAKCNCVDTTVKFEIQDGRGVCKKPDGVPVVDPDPVDPVDPGVPDIPNVPDDVVPDVTIDYTTIQIRTLTNRITAASGKIDDIALDTTVWRTADGKFNTARLASDSIAGIVLGTAGGLITSNIIKKNQIENGFEDLSCTIGGQVVSGWHDEFVVGVR